MWLYQCQMAGLKPGDLRQMRIDQAEAWVELHEFIDDAITHRKEDAEAASAEDSFWNL